MTKKTYCIGDDEMRVDAKNKRQVKKIIKHDYPHLIGLKIYKYKGAD